MIKIKYVLPILFVASLSLVSCGDDDNKPEDPVVTTDDDGGMPDEGDSTATVEMMQEASIITLTSGNEKVWRISSATLNNDTGAIDISTNFNVVDDEFIFSGTRTNGNMEWRPGNAIAIEGASSQETLLDFYVSSEKSSFTFNADSGTELTGLDGRFTFKVVDENNITATLTFNNGRSLAGETMDLTLVEKRDSDYAQPPSGGLNFTEATTFMAYRSYGQQHNAGLVGSYSDNSLYVAYRNDCNPSGRSKIFKYSIDTGVFVTRDDTFLDFFTRKLNIVNNELLLIGGNNVYQYDLNLSTSPTIIPHNAGNLSRYTTAVVNNDLYVVGGNLDAPADKIRKINSATGALDIVGTLPSPKVHAGAEILNDQLYIFSGRNAFFDNTGVSTTSYIYDIVNDTVQTFQTPVALNNSYAAKYQNLIYVVGDTQTDSNNDGTVDDYNVWTGVYDTQTGVMTEIVNNLDDTDNFSFIHSMTVFNDNMYITYGDISRNDPMDNCTEFEWSIMVAPIN